MSVELKRGIQNVCTSTYCLDTALISKYSHKYRLSSYHHIRTDVFKTLHNFANNCGKLFSIFVFYVCLR